MTAAALPAASLDSRRYAAQAGRLIVALDFTALPDALRVARRLQDLVRTVKVGSALFTACGPLAIQRLRSLGFAIMLDLKFYDIPSTVAHSCRAAVHHGVSMLTVHAAGGPAMLEAAVCAVRGEARRRRRLPPRVLGVTVLTSVRGRTTSARRVVQLAGVALQAGCDGVVASAREASALRRRFGKKPLIVCPGVRPSSASHADQQRVATPREALRAGADVLVVGRPITEAENPHRATERILMEMEDST